MQDSVTFFFSHPSILHFLLTFFFFWFPLSAENQAWLLDGVLAGLLACQLDWYARCWRKLDMNTNREWSCFHYYSYCSCLRWLSDLYPFAAVFLFFLSLFYTRFNLFTLWRLSLSHVLNNWCQSWTGPAGHRYLHSWEQVFVGVNQRTGPMLW